MHPRFLRGFVLTLAGLALLTIPFSLFLRTIGEIDIDHVVARQQAGEPPVLFNSGLQADFFAYKAALADFHRPEIVVVGSSTAMPFRGEFFAKPFSNWGGAAYSNGSLAAVVTALIAAPVRPRVALVVIDMWWFNPRFSSPEEQYTPPPYPKIPNAAVIYGALQASWRNASRIDRVISPVPGRLGMLALIANEGFDRFGSYHYTSMAAGDKPPHDPRFEDTSSRIRDGRTRFEYGDVVDKTLVAQFIASIRRLEESGIHAVLLFPPFAHRVKTQMDASGRYGYVSDLKRTLNRDGFRFHDYSDITVLPDLADPDCEFIDGFHGGDVTAARILRHLASQDADVAARVNDEYLASFIASKRGRAEGVDYFNNGRKEVDFLQLGCVK